MEICQVEAVPQSLQRGPHHACALQHHPLTQSCFLHLKVSTFNLQRHYSSICYLFIFNSVPGVYLDGSAAAALVILKMSIPQYPLW